MAAKNPGVHTASEADDDDTENTGVPPPKPQDNGATGNPGVPAHANSAPQDEDAAPIHPPTTRRTTSTSHVWRWLLPRPR